MGADRKSFKLTDYQAIRLFRNVDLDAVRGLIEGCDIMHLDRGEIIIAPGQMNHRVYIILEGRIGIHLDSPDKDPITVLDAGESVGEMSVIDKKPASAYAVAETPCQLLVMDEDILWSLVHASHHAACNLLTTLTKRLRRMDHLIAGDQDVELTYEQRGTFDALTGLHNRFWLENTLERLVRRALSNQDTLSVIVMDIDYFQSFNERYGRIQGDRFLYFLVHVLTGNLRPTELITRSGDDEFVVLLPNIDTKGARIIADRLRNAIDSALPLSPDGRVIPHPTISMGIAGLTDGDTGPSLLSAAEAALYKAKNSGRNCTIISTDHSG